MKRAALVLATSVALFICAVGNANAATRKYVSLPSNGQVIGSGNGSSRSGDTLHVPGDGKTEYIPSSYGGGSKGTKLPIKVKYDYSIPRTIKGMSGSLRGGVVGVGLSIGLQYMLDAVDGIIDDGQVKVPASGSPVPGGYYWKSATEHIGSDGTSSFYTGLTPVEVCSQIAAAGWRNDYVYDRLERVSDTQYRCIAKRESDGYESRVSIQRYGDSCPAGSTYNSSTGACEAAGGYRAATDADFDLMEAAAAAQDSEWLKDRLREHCEGSLAPESCYQELRTSTQLEGPSTLTEKGPAITTTGPGGTTSSTTNTQIDITYGDNYYDYRKTSTVTTTNPDGTTETETKTDPEEVTEEQDQDEGAIEYSDADMPEVEPFYQQKYPDGLAGVWHSVSSNIENSAFLAFLSSFVPNFSGSCPTFSLQFNIASWANYGTISFWNMCWIFEFIKTVLIVSAVFLARALTFGG
jgi:hypothetical protein